MPKYDKAKNKPPVIPDQNVYLLSMLNEKSRMFNFSEAPAINMAFEKVMSSGKDWIMT